MKLKSCKLEKEEIRNYFEIEEKRTFNKKEVEEYEQNCDSYLADYLFRPWVSCFKRLLL